MPDYFAFLCMLVNLTSFYVLNKKLSFSPIYRTTEDHVADGIEARKHEGSVSGRSTTTPEIIFNTEKEQSSSDSE